MLMVLPQWLCGKVWESEFSYLWQQRTCHCVCSLGYIYITATKSRVDWSLWLSIYYSPITHVSCHIHSTLTSHSPLFLSSIILIKSGGRYNLWSYILFKFIQFPITFSYKILRSDQHQHYSQTQFRVFLQCHRPSITPTSTQYYNYVMTLRL